MRTDDEDIEKIDYEIYSIGELQEIIGNMENNPVDKRRKEYKEYVKLLNTLFDLYNRKANYKIYKKIK